VAHALPSTPAVETDLPIFLNPRAGRGAVAEQPALERAFTAVGARPIIRIVAGNELQDAVREAVAAGAAIIGAAGGDGTISSAATAIAGTQSALLPVPLGTLNHFAMRYGVSSVDASAHAWERKSIEQIHIGEVGNLIFVNNASVGFYPHLIRHREKLERVLPRMAAMWLAGFRVLAELPMLRMQVDTGEAHHAIRTPALWVGIGRNSLRLPVPGDADVEEVVLEAVWGRADKRRRVVALSFRLARHIKRGLEPRDRDLDVLRMREFTLTASDPIDIALDGEPFRLETPLRFAIRENGLRVLVLVAPAP
jgi:diacylglycerol kinase family enzyme